MIKTVLTLKFTSTAFLLVVSH